VKSLLLLLSLAAPVLAAGNETGSPADAALRYVTKLRSGEVDLGPGKDTALSPATGPDKRKLIADRVKRLAGELGPGAVEAGAQKLDGDMAAVLIHQATGFDPARLRVVAIGLIQKDGTWHPAPVPGSFENTGLGYDDSRSKRLADLETWMLQEQTTELASLRDQSSERLRQAIERNLPKEELRHATPEKVVKILLQACSRRDQATTLGLLGGLQAELPGDWSVRVAAVDQAFSNETASGPWHYLVSNGVIRTFLGKEATGREATLSLSCLDASGEVGHAQLPQIKAVNLDLQQDASGVWRVDLPSSFFTPEPPEERGTKENPPVGPELQNVVKSWQHEHPPILAPTPEAARDAVFSALSAKEPDGLLSLIDLTRDPAEATLGMARLSLIWRDLHHPRDVRTLLPLAFHQIGDGAIAAFQVFRSREPELADVRQVYLSKNGSGWQLVSGLRPAEPIPPALSEIKAWADAESTKWTENWKAIALSGSPALESIPAGEAPAEADVRSTFDTWNEAIARGDILTTIGLTARLNRDDYAKWLLQNLGGELTGAKKETRMTAVLGVIRRGPWTAVSARIGKAGDEDATYPLYPFVNTPAGPRVLAGIDIFANGSRTRDFLNQNSFSRLEAAGDADAAASLKEIYEIHRKSAEADRPPVPAK